MSGSRRTPRRTYRAPTPFGRVELVARDREEIDAELVDLRRDLADRLGGVGVEQDAALAGDGAHGLNRLDRPDLVVRVHDAHEDRSRCDRPAHVIGVDATGPIYVEVGDARTKALEKAGRLEDRGMLDRGRDDVVAASHAAGGGRRRGRGCRPRCHRS